jgi:hypothetical protein
LSPAGKACQAGFRIGKKTGRGRTVQAAEGQASRIPHQRPQPLLGLLQAAPVLVEKASAGDP